MIIAHLDMDSFFASIEERENPQYKGLGIVVGADPKGGLGRGVVSTANYQARKYGIHSALPISTAWRLAQSAYQKGEPKTVFLPVNMAFYEKVSDKIMGIIRKYVEVVEQTSIDEAYLDLSFCGKKQVKHDVILVSEERAHPGSYGDSGQARMTISIVYAKVVDLIKKIKEEIKLRENLTASVGIGPNKLIAKMVSAKFKPDGLTVVKPDEVEKFLDPLPIGDIPGIGPKSEEFFHSKNIYKVSQLKQISKDQLLAWMGKWGEDIYLKVRGLDDSIVSTLKEIKSISEQETFDTDTLSASILLDKLNKLAERVIISLNTEGIKSYKTITIVVRFADFTTKSRSHTLSQKAGDFSTLKKESLKLFLPFLDRRENPKLMLIRLIGVGIDNFDAGNDVREKTSEQTKLFNTCPDAVYDPPFGGEKLQHRGSR